MFEKNIDVMSLKKWRNGMLKGNISIGAGILNKEYMEKYDDRMYSSYNRIMSQIDEFRCFANEYFESNLKKNKKSIVQQVKPNNTISIIGDRGVGKTSLMLTVLNELQWLNVKEEIEREENIILPIIDPEKFNAEKNALGWVIFCFEEILEKYNKFNNKYCTDKQKYFEELKIIYDKLKMTYINSRDNARKEMSVFISGNSEYNKIAEKVIFSDMILARMTDDFINKFIDYVKKNISPEIQPLIFITFDDIDLCPEHGIKIMNTILEYLSNPAIITIVLGKVDNFIIGIDNHLIKVGKVYELESERDENKKSANKTTMEILKKGLPPFFRNYIKKLSYAEIMYFIPYGDEIKYKYTFEEKLTEVKINDLKKLKLIDFFNLENAIPFINSSDIIKNYGLKFIENSNGIYTDILPQRPRDAINFYFLLGQMTEEKNEFERFIILYDYFYNIIDYKKEKINYLDEIFQIDRAKKQIKIRNKFNNIIFYIGKIENYIEENSSNDNFWVQDTERFIEELNDVRDSNIIEEFHFLSNKIHKNRIRGMSIFDIILEITNNRNYKERVYFENFDYSFEKISRRFNERFYDSKRNAESEQEVDAKYSTNLILFTMDRVFDNTKLYLNQKENSEELKIRTEIEREIVKEIKDDISIIKNEINKLEKIIVSLNSKEKITRRKKEQIEKDIVNVIKSGLSNIRFYDELNETKINDEDGLIIQFLLDISIEMGNKIGFNDSNKITDKMKKVTETMKKRFTPTIKNEIFTQEKNIEKFSDYYIYTIVEENQATIVNELQKEENLKNIKVKIKKMLEEKDKRKLILNNGNKEDLQAVTKKIITIEEEIKILEIEENILTKEVEHIKDGFKERKNKIIKIEKEIKDRK